jgi:hypothetical protein
MASAGPVNAGPSNDGGTIVASACSIRPAAMSASVRTPA